jgi:proteasome lid subunit RPN8/RPN11
MLSKMQCFKFPIYTEMLYLSTDHRVALRRAYENALPRECCGVLLGNVCHGSILVRSVVPTLNPVGDRKSFAIPDFEIWRAGQTARKNGLSIAAIYHSHPSGNAQLSWADEAAVLLSALPWIIVTWDAAMQSLRLRGVTVRCASRLPELCGIPIHITLGVDTVEPLASCLSTPPSG